MGDKSPKDREKKKKQHVKHVEDNNRVQQEKAQKKTERVETPPQDQQRKAG